jgi:hypothetical protein
MESDCEFYKSCGNRSNYSYRCKNGGGPNCGKWKEFKEQEIEKGLSSKPNN